MDNTVPWQKIWIAYAGGHREFGLHCRGQSSSSEYPELWGGSALKCEGIWGYTTYIQFVASAPDQDLCRKPCVAGCASKPFGQKFPGCSIPSHCLTHSRWRFVEQQVKPLCLRRSTVGLEVLGEISKKAALFQAEDCVVLSIPFRFVWASGISTVERSHAVSRGSRGAHWSKVLSKAPHFCLTSALAAGSASACVDTNIPGWRHLVCYCRGDWENSR